LGTFDELITKEKLNNRIKELGQRITEDYKEKNLMVVCVLKGSILFFSDLIREIKLNFKCEFLTIESYVGIKNTKPIITCDSLQMYLTDVDILVIEDIVDTGHTLTKIEEWLNSKNPKSIKYCSMLNKPSKREVVVNVDYIGFEIPDKFVIGYGLDYNGLYRNLPYVAELKTSH